MCFKAHQAAEKALKAAQFSVDAVASFSHDLPSLAATIEDQELRSLAIKLQVRNYDLFTRVCNYRPQQSWGKVMFLHVSVILFTGEVGTAAGTFPGQVHPPGQVDPPSR